MTAERKSFSIRERELKLAIARIKSGRSSESKISFASVAREAGVSTALIHNYHPEIAQSIRAENGKSSNEKLKIRDQSLAAEKKKNKELRAELKKLTQNLAKIASINENLLAEIRSLQPKRGGSKVVRLEADKR